MPFGSLSDLPAEVLAVLPKDAAELFRRVANSAIAAEPDNEAEALATAWAALENAGWSKTPAGTYALAKSRSPVSTGSDGETFEVRIPVSHFVQKSEGEPGKVFGWAYTAVDADGQIHPDHDGDIIPADELEAAAYEFTKASGAANVMHDGPDVGSVIESVFLSPKKRVAMGLDGTGPVAWWVGLEVDAATMKRVRSGELREFSIEGTAVPEEVAA